MRPVSRVYLWDEAEGRFFGQGPYELLQGVEQTGSLRAAAARMDMAYTKALAILRRAERVLGTPLTQTAIGGRGGGGSRLTPAAHQLLARYKAWREDCAAYAAARWQAGDAAPPVRVGCVLMASGQGRRFGGNKLLAEFAGQPLVAHALALARTPGLCAAVAVTRWPEVAQLCSAAGVPVVQHSLPGRSDTIRLGLAALQAGGQPLHGALFLPCDQPLLRPATLQALLQAFAGQPQYIWRTACGDVPGSPAIFPAWAFARLWQLQGNEGGGVVAAQNPQQVKCLHPAHPAELQDADTPAQLARLQQLYNTLYPAAQP